MEYLLIFLVVFFLPIFLFACYGRSVTRSYWGTSGRLPLTSFGTHVTVLIFLLGVGGGLSPKVSQAASDTAQVWSTAGEASAKQGIGLTQVQALTLFKTLGFTLQVANPVNGHSRWKGQDQSKLRIGEVVGDGDTILRVLAVSAIPSDQAEDASMIALITFSRMLDAVCPAWEGRASWLLKAIEANGGQSFDCNGTSVKLAPVGGKQIFMLSIGQL